MSDTLNRPMFKRGPDGQMRQAAQAGGLFPFLKQGYKAAKYIAPKFTNVPYNFNQMMARMGVPTITGKKRVTGIAPPFVGPQGPQAYSTVGPKSYDWRMKWWTNKFNNLKGKHKLGNIEASGLRGMKNLPQEVIDHWKAHPKMSKRRALAEQAAYGFGVPMAMNWASPDFDPHVNAKEELGSMDDNKEEANPITPGSDRQPGLEGPKIPGTNVPDTDHPETSPPTELGEDYDGPVGPSFSDEETGKFSGMPALTAEVKDIDDSVSLDGIDKYKKELRDLIGKEDKTMGSLMLMQLGLGMMAGKSDQPGFAGFMEILGKTGQQVLPMWMEHMQGRRKEDKEIALAAYEMLREDRAAKTERAQALLDHEMKQKDKKDWWYEQKEWENIYRPSGDLAMIQKNEPIPQSDGSFVDNWVDVAETFTKSSLALDVLYNGDPKKIKVVPFNITEAGMKATGLGDKNLTRAQQGENVMLANIYEKNFGQILNFVMDPEIGLHSGNFKTGGTGGVIKVLRFADREIQQAWRVIKGDKLIDNPTKAAWGLSKTVEQSAMQELIQSGGLIQGEGNEWSVHDGKKAKDVVHGTYMVGYPGQEATQVTGNFATEQYVKNLTDNQFYDTNQQLVNMMGFLSARLKQPTGRLLADTIRRSIEAIDPQRLGSGDPVQMANKMHFFIKQLYEAYASHSLLGGKTPKTTFEGGRGLVELSIPNYNQSYLRFAGDEATDRGVNLGWMDSSPVTEQNISSDIYGGKDMIIKAPADLSEHFKWIAEQ